MYGSFVKIYDKINSVNNDKNGLIGVIICVILAIKSFRFQMELWVDKIFESRVSKIRDDSSSGEFDLCR